MLFSAIQETSKRRSVRTFKNVPIKETDLEVLKKILNDCGNPFGIEVFFRILDAKENGLSSPVISGADLYLGAKVSRASNFEIALGYSFEKALLQAGALGLGGVMLASTLNREAFEKAMDLSSCEVMPVASPLGYPAEKKSLKETLMRKALKADSRLPFSKLFFGGTYGSGIEAAESGIFKDALEAVRLAPSAANKQPWRCVLKGDVVHFFEEKTMKESSMCDIQKVDLGIGLCHFDLVMKEKGVSGSFFYDKNEHNVPDNVEYVISYKVK